MHREEVKQLVSSIRQAPDQRKRANEVIKIIRNQTTWEERRHISIYLHHNLGGPINSASNNRFLDLIRYIISELNKK